MEGVRGEVPEERPPVGKGTSGGLRTLSGYIHSRDYVRNVTSGTANHEERNLRVGPDQTPWSGPLFPCPLVPMVCSLVGTALGSTPKSTLLR